MVKTVVTIEGRRDHYSEMDCAEQTCTVGDLIRLLEEYDSEMPVMLKNDNGYTYGEIHGYTIEEEDVELDEEDEEEYEEDEDEEC